MEKQWSLSNMPPEGHPDVGEFFWSLFEASEAEKKRLALHERWLENHRLWRGGAVNRGMKTLVSKHAVSANLIFSNVNRTVANLTAKNPSAEVISLDGQDFEDPETGEVIKDETDVKATTKMKERWKHHPSKVSIHP